MKSKLFLQFEWDKFVGRRQPPLRGLLVYEGFISWLKKRYKYDFSYLFLNFSKKTAKSVTTDSFVNQQLEDILKKFINEELHKDTLPFHNDIKNFRRATQSLLDFSKDLTKNTKDNPALIFEHFCTIWKNFAPGLLFIIFLEDVCTDEIVKEFQDKEQAKTLLMQIISQNVESKLFKHKKNLLKTKGETGFSKKSQKYIQLLIEIAQFRDWRKVVYDDCWYTHSASLFQQIGEATSFYEHIDWVSPDAIAKALQKKRKFVFNNEALVYFDHEQKGIAIAYGKDILTLKQKIIDSLVKDEIRGMVACLGKAVGRVKIIEPHAKVKNFKQGSILVAKMTTPDLVSIIKKAAAIVTDEGGVTSHAAIISREMKIPCIVGTKIATQVFKDGDLIEVDAINGIVKKL